MLPDQSQCPCLHAYPRMCTFRHFSICARLIACHSPQPSWCSGPGSVWLHTDACACLHVCAHTRTQIREPALSCWNTSWSIPMTPTYKCTHTVTVATQTTAEEVTVGSCMCVDWSAGPRCPDSLPSTSSPLLLCRDSHHNGRCLWTCQAAKDTKTTPSTFDIRSCHQKTKDKLSWQLC